MPRFRPSSPAAFLAAALLVAASGAKDTPPAAVTLLRADSLAASEPAANFTEIRDLAVDSRGQVYVADFSGQITVLSADGRVLRHIGRSGSGPGEFNSLAQLRILPGDSLFVFDNGVERVSLYGPGDSLPATSVQLAANQLLFPYWVAPAAGGRLVAAYRAAYSADDGRSGGAVRREFVRLMNADGSVLRDTLFSYPEAELLVLHGEVEGVAGSPFGRRTVLAMGPGGTLYSAWSGDARVEVHPLDGSAARTLALASQHSSQAITAAERDSVVAMLSSGIMPAQAVRRAVEASAHHPWPVIRDLLVDERGGLWLGLAGRPREPVTWTAYDARGRETARFELPAALELRALRGGRAYAVEKDRDDVPRVRIFALTSIQAEAKP
jgi:hypothetical protein